jgi:adenylate kinase
MRIVILGAPGSGKKTQTDLLADHYKLNVITVSELVKQAQSQENELGLQLRMLQQAGHSPTDDVVLGLLEERLNRLDLSNGFILDGFPRNLLQALTLDELLDEMGLTLDFVLLFEIEIDALMERLVGRRTCRSCGSVYNIYTHPSAVEDVCDFCGGRLHQRADDTEESVSSRLHVFDHLTAPLLSYYGKQGKVVRINGEGEVYQVLLSTCRAIEVLSQKEPSAKPAAQLRKSSSASRNPAAKRIKRSTESAKPVKKGAPKKKASSNKVSQKKAAPKKAQPKRVTAKKTGSIKAAKKKTAKKGAGN